MRDTKYLLARHLSFALISAMGISCMSPPSAISSYLLDYSIEAPFINVVHNRLESLCGIGALLSSI